MRDIRDIVADIDALDLAGDSQPAIASLDALVTEYFTHAEAAKRLEVWFRLFERFPESDGCEVFWSILHGVEAQPSSDEYVVASVLRKPTHFPVVMVNRILNSGCRMVGREDLIELLRSVAANEQVSARVRRNAERFVAHQNKRDA